jgi:hypothetical protein
MVESGWRKWIADRRRGCTTGPSPLGHIFIFAPDARLSRARQSGAIPLRDASQGEKGQREGEQSRCWRREEKKEEGKRE